MRIRGRSSSSAYAALNRRELPATTPDWVNIDHRRRAIARGDGGRIPPSRAWDLMPDVSISYRGGASAERPRSGLSPMAAHGSSQEGFDVEWRGIERYDRRRRPDQPLRDIRRGRPRRRPRPLRRTAAHTTRHWKTRQAEHQTASSRTSGHATGTAMAEILADDNFVDDRRRVVDAGVWHGRDALIIDMRAIAEWRTRM